MDAAGVDCFGAARGLGGGRPNFWEASSIPLGSGNGRIPTILPQGVAMTPSRMVQQDPQS